MQQQIFGLMTPLLASVFAVIFLAIWWRGRLGVHVLAYSGSYALFVAGFVSTLFLPIEAPYLFNLSHAFYSAAAALLIWGGCTRLGRPPHLGILLAIYAITAITLGIAVGLTNDVGPRLLIANAGYGTMFLVAFVSLMGSPRHNGVDYAMMAVLAFHTIDFMVRPVLALLIEGSIPAGTYRDSVYFSIINLVLMTKALTTALVLLGMCAIDVMQAIHERSNRDPLTGLRNRRGFERDISSPLARAHRTGTPVSLIVADIDHFKQVNDVWGHQVGDKAIVAFAELIAGMIRDQDISARIGGEEFCILVWDCPPEGSAGLAERIRSEFAQSEQPDLGANISLSASFGVASLESGENYHSLFARADAALYNAKENGRNRVSTSTERGRARKRRSGEFDEAREARAAA